MNRILGSLVALAALVFALPARADSIYSFENTSDGVYSSDALSGTITISTAGDSYAVTGGDFTYGGNTFSTLGATGIYVGGNYFYGDFTDAGGDTYYVYIVFPPSVGTGDYSLCTYPAYCYDAGADEKSSGFMNEAGTSDVDLESGDLAPVISATPEPSSLILLGTGILGAAGLARRKFAKA